MNPETRNKLLGFIAEYGQSLERVQAEKELQKAIEERGELECRVPPKHLRTVATALWRDKSAEVKAGMEETLGLFEVVSDDDAATHEKPITVSIHHLDSQDGNQR